MSVKIDYADLIGVPFEYGGRGPEKFDCWGLLMALNSRVHGVTLPDFRSVSQVPRIAKIMRENMSQWRPIEPRPGSSILFEIEGFGAHVGFQVDDYNFLHTWEDSGGVLRERLDFWQHRNLGHYEFVGG